MVSNASGVSVGMEAGYSQFGAGILAKSASISACAARPAHLRGRRSGAAIAAAFNAPLAGRLLRLRADPRRLFGTGAGAGRRRLAGRDAQERALMHPTELFVIGPFPRSRQWFYRMFALLGALAAGLQHPRHAMRDLGRAPAAPAADAAVAAPGGRRAAGERHGAGRAAGAGQRAWRDPELCSTTIRPCGRWRPGGRQAGRLGDLAGAGFRGGMFSSSLLLGCLSAPPSARRSGFWRRAWSSSSSVLMLVGMASVAAAVIGSPLTMVFLVLEGTDNFPVTVGVMVGVVIASTIVRLTFGYSFSTWRFHQRGSASAGRTNRLARRSHRRPADARGSQDRARDHAVDRAT